MLVDRKYTCKILYSSAIICFRNNHIRVSIVSDHATTKFDVEMSNADICYATKAPTYLLQFEPVVGIGLWDFDSLDDYFGELLHMLAVSGDLILVAVFK